MKSEYIKQFLDFLDEATKEYSYALDIVETEDKRTQDLLHAIEFESQTKERAKMATKLRNSRMIRRENKDIVEVLEPVIAYMKDEKNTRALNQLTQLLGQVRKVEKYHENRSYHPKVEVK